MKNFDQIFWTVIGAVGIWATVTPGHQLGFLGENNRYNILNQLSPVVTVMAFLVLGVMIFKTK